MTAAGSKRRISVATYNIHGGVGADKRMDLARIAAVIREVDADIVALQEVATVRDVTGAAVSQLDALARRLDYREVVAGPTLERADGPYGNGLLCRLPIRRRRALDLSVRRREPRGAIIAELDGGLRVIATHLGLRAGERREQWRRLLELLGADDSPAIIAGDLNEWWPSRRSLRLRLGHPVPRLLATYPARLPLLALDRIIVRPADALVRLQVHRSRLQRVASDHSPLRADIAIGPSA